MALELSHRISQLRAHLNLRDTEVRVFFFGKLMFLVCKLTGISATNYNIMHII